MESKGQRNNPREMKSLGRKVGGEKKKYQGIKESRKLLGRERGGLKKVIKSEVTTRFK